MGFDVFHGWTGSQTVVISANANTAGWNADWSKNSRAVIETK